MAPNQFYTVNREILLEEQRKLSNKLRIFRLFRLVIFTLAVFGLYSTFGNFLLFLFVVIVAIVLFLFILSRYTDLKLKKEITEAKIKLISNEIDALNGDLSHFSEGEKHEDPAHPFASDLDVFKRNGVFSFVNRTVTKLGENQLKNQLLYGEKNTDIANQVIQKIAKNNLWTFDFRAVAVLNTREKGVDKNLSSLDWNLITVENWFKIARVVIPFIALISIVLFGLSFISVSFFSLLVVVCLAPSFRVYNTTNQLADQVSDFDDKCAILKEQAKTIELELSKNGNDTEWLKSVLGFDISDMIVQVSKLQKIINRLNTRKNMLLGTTFNFLFAWDIQQRIALYNWRLENENKILEWENGLAKLEVYISGATVLFNYPETIFAKFSDKNEVKMECIYHPLIAYKYHVQNDFSLNEKQQIMLLTGPNMAGKSTYLRAVGCAIIFANAGFPVFAEYLEIPKMSLYTSMRTTDDLSEQSSYFFAELSRLKLVMNAVEKQGNVFVLLDEILKGTNSKDKEEGSYLFMEKLQRLGAKGIIATHDLSLCGLAVKKDVFFTAHFDSLIENENLSFDYTIKPGVCKNMNASFLLRKMQLID
jgi:membrane protein implicated in regulation of membrane protease activity